MRYNLLQSGITLTKLNEEFINSALSNWGSLIECDAWYSQSCRITLRFDSGELSIDGGPGDNYIGKTREDEYTPSFHGCVLLENIKIFGKPVKSLSRGIALSCGAGDDYNTWPSTSIYVPELVLTGEELDLINRNINNTYPKIKPTTKPQGSEYSYISIGSNRQRSQFTIYYHSTRNSNHHASVNAGIRINNL